MAMAIDGKGVKNMLDALVIKGIRYPLHQIAKGINKSAINANQLTLVGFSLGTLAIPALAYQHYILALVFILLNRLLDGLDGALARIQGISDAGGFLDICLDFLFYAFIPLGFILADPVQNAVSGSILLCAFIGTGSSFLAFAAVAGKRGLVDPIYQHKSLYYMKGLTEGTETIICFVLMCLFPNHFSVIACCFAALCGFTVISRIYSGFYTLNIANNKDH